MVPEERRKRFGEQLRAARKERGWSQKRLAEELQRALGGGAQITQGAVTQWETGKTTPRRDRVGPMETLLRLTQWTLTDVLDGTSRATRAARLPAGTGALSGIDTADLTADEVAQVQGYVDALRERRRAEG